MNNPILAEWYTDTADIYRVVTEAAGQCIFAGPKKINTVPIPCRVYSSKRDGPAMTGTAAAERSTEKMACDLFLDIQPGDELEVTRGGRTWYAGKAGAVFCRNPTGLF